MIFEEGKIFDGIHGRFLWKFDFSMFMLKNVLIFLSCVGLNLKVQLIYHSTPRISIMYKKILQKVCEISYPCKSEKSLVQVHRFLKVKLIKKMGSPTDNGTNSTSNGERKAKKPFLIGVSGGTASGKVKKDIQIHVAISSIKIFFQSTVCKKIIEKLGQTEIAEKQRQVNIKFHIRSS